MELELTSTAFQEGETIPQEFTGDGRNSSPPLKWSNPPSGTKSLALVCEDPDAPKGTFTHWVVFNLPPESRELAEGVPQEPALANGTIQGTNGMGRIGYVGPSPPPGKKHHYAFKLYALDTSVDLPSGASLRDLRAVMPGHVLAESELTGIYGR
jgi:Raf kinase inhibitor-like YbhB/YbcL family protein